MGALTERADLAIWRRSPVAPFIDPIEHDHEIRVVGRRPHHQEVLAVGRDLGGRMAALSGIALEEHATPKEDVPR